MSCSEFVSPDALLDLGFCSPRIGGQGGGEIPLPPDVQNSDPPQTNNLFTTVPPSNWMAAGGGRNND